MPEDKLYMLLLGAKPPGRHTEQHDIFFGIGHSLKDCLPAIRSFWPEAGEKIHIDAWREVSHVSGHRIMIRPAKEGRPAGNTKRLFFINLGGYRPGEFEEFHYKVVVAADSKEEAIAAAKKETFFKHIGSPHVDDKYGIDVDDIYSIEDVLPEAIKLHYEIDLLPESTTEEDDVHLGYLKLNEL